MNVTSSSPFLTVSTTSISAALQISTQVGIGIFLSHPRVAILNPGASSSLSMLLFYVLWPLFMVEKFATSITWEIVKNIWPLFFGGLFFQMFSFCFAECAFNPIFFLHSRYVRKCCSLSRTILVFTICYQNCTFLPLMFLEAFAKTDIFVDPKRLENYVTLVTIISLPELILFYSFGVIYYELSQPRHESVKQYCCEVVSCWFWNFDWVRRTFSNQDRIVPTSSSRHKNGRSATVTTGSSSGSQIIDFHIFTSSGIEVDPGASAFPPLSSHNNEEGDGEKEVKPRSQNGHCDPLELCDPLKRSHSLRYAKSPSVFGHVMSKDVEGCSGQLVKVVNSDGETISPRDLGSNASSISDIDDEESSDGSQYHQHQESIENSSDNSDVVDRREELEEDSSYRSNHSSIISNDGDDDHSSSSEKREDNHNHSSETNYSSSSDKFVRTEGYSSSSSSKLRCEHSNIRTDGDFSISSSINTYIDSDDSTSPSSSLYHQRKLHEGSVSKNRLKTCLSRSTFILRKVFSPPLMGILLGTTIALIPHFKDIFFLDPPPIIDAFPAVVNKFSSCILAVAMLLTGSNLGRFLFQQKDKKKKSHSKNDKGRRRIPRRRRRGEKRKSDLRNKRNDTSSSSSHSPSSRRFRWKQISSFCGDFCCRGIIRQNACLPLTMNVCSKLVFLPLFILGVMTFVAFGLKNTNIIEPSLRPMTYLIFVLEAAAPLMLSLNAIALMFKKGGDQLAEIMIFQYTLFPFTMVFFCIVSLYIFCSIEKEQCTLFN